MIVWLLLGSAVVIVLGLTAYAGKLLWQLRQQRAKHNAEAATRAAQQHSKVLRLADSIDTIAMAMQQDQCNYAEGALRICVLLDHLAPNLEDNPDYQQRYPQFHSFYSQIKHLATHQQRQQLSAAERRQQDAHRHQCEMHSKTAITAQELPKLRQEMQAYLQPQLH